MTLAGLVVLTYVRQAAKTLEPAGRALFTRTATEARVRFPVEA